MSDGRVPHLYDFLTSFCMICGAAEEAEVDGTRPTCTDAGNVIGMAHLMARKRFGIMIPQENNG